jgi:hypothetical protein
MPLCARSRGLLPLASVGHERRLNLQQQPLPEIGLMSGLGLTVWTGRALQAESGELVVIGLAHLYPALEWSSMLLAIMDIRAHPISFSVRP